MSSQESSPITQWREKIQETVIDCVDFQDHKHEKEIQQAITSATIELIAGLKVYVCRSCGYHPANRANWCDKGCGNDYNQMHEVDLRQSLKELQ